MKTKKLILSLFAFVSLSLAACSGEIPATNSSEGTPSSGDTSNTSNTSSGGGSTDVAVTGVTVSPTAITLQEGQFQLLSAAVAPNNATDKRVAWTTDNASVASVNNGNVIAHSVGTAHITVTSVADSTKFGTCTVTVTPAPQDPKASIVIEGTPSAEVTTFDDGNVETDYSWQFTNLSFAANDEVSFKVDGTPITILSDGDSSGNNIVEDHPYSEAKASVHVKDAVVSGGAVYLHHHTTDNSYSFWIMGRVIPTSEVKFTVSNCSTVLGQGIFLVGNVSGWVAKDEYKIEYKGEDTEHVGKYVYESTLTLPDGNLEFKFVVANEESKVIDDWEKDGEGNQRSLVIGSSTPAQNLVYGEYELPSPYTAKKNGADYALVDVKGPSSTNNAEYVIPLAASDVLTIKKNADVLHFYHTDTSVLPNVDVDDGDEFEADEEGTYTFYVTSEDKVFHTFMPVLHEVTAKKNGTTDVLLTDVPEEHGPTDLAVYHVTLDKNDTISFKEGTTDLHFYHDGGTEQVDDGISYEAPRDGEYVFYVNSLKRIYVQEPEIVHVYEVSIGGTRHPLTDYTPDPPETGIVLAKKLQNVAVNEDQEVIFLVDDVAVGVFSDGSSSSNNIKEDHPYAVAKTSVTIKSSGTVDVCFKQFADQVENNNYNFWITTEGAVPTTDSYNILMDDDAVAGRVIKVHAWKAGSEATVFEDATATCSSKVVSFELQKDKGYDHFVIAVLKEGKSDYGEAWADVDYQTADLLINATTASWDKNNLYYYLSGEFNSWATCSSEYKFTYNTTAGEYQLLGVTLAAGGIKVSSNTGNWYPSDYGAEKTITAGTYNIYFKADGSGGDDWHYHYFYVQEVVS